jgi:altronate hydrolase
VSLLHIHPAVTAETAAIQLHPADNVAIARVPLTAGQPVVVGSREVRAHGPITAGHKIALCEIPAGGQVVRYGCSIGKARATIRAGEHVHTHNLSMEGISTVDALPTEERAAPPVMGDVPNFLGYSRPDGRAGTRNYVAVVAASNCASHTSEMIAARFPAESLPDGVDGVVAFPHGEGCGHTVGPDTEQLHRVIAGVLDHPNVAAALLIGLGCEVNQVSGYSGSFTPLTLQTSGGTRATVEAGVREVKRALELAAGYKRSPIPASKIVLGLNCGGSDSFSGISANPAVGVCSDMLAAIGATAVLAETTEIFGAEHLLLRRARNPQVAEKLLEYVRAYRQYLSHFGGSYDDNPSPGNKQGGLTNIAEKSLGAVAKSGTSLLMDAVDYAERISSPGFVFMNTPGYDPISLTGLAAGGVNVIAFTTGRGSAIGFPTVPVVKISSNSAIFDTMRDNIDLNAGRVMDGTVTVKQVGREIFERVLAVASGLKTSSESLGHHEFVPWRIGPVL